MILMLEIVYENGDKKIISKSELEAIARAEKQSLQTLKYMKSKITNYRQTLGTNEEKHNFEVEYWKHIILIAQNMLVYLGEPNPSIL